MSEGIPPVAALAAARLTVAMLTLHVGLMRSGGAPRGRLLVADAELKRARKRVAELEQESPAAVSSAATGLADPREASRE